MTVPSSIGEILNNAGAPATDRKNRGGRSGIALQAISRSLLQVRHTARPLNLR